MDVQTIWKNAHQQFGEHIRCEYSMSTIWTLDNIENKYSLYHGEDCVKTFCSSLKEHATNIINFEKKKMLPLTKRRAKITLKTQQNVTFAEKDYQKSLLKIKIIKKLETIAILLVNIEVKRIVYVI